MGPRRAGVTLSLVAVLAISACGGDDEPAGGATTGPDQAARAEPAAATSPSGSTASLPATAVGPPVSAPPSGPATATAAPTEDVAVSLTEVATLDTPVDLAWRDGDDGLYVVEQDGRVVRIGTDETTTVLDVSDLTEAQGERGLLGLAFAPSGDVAYINYTDNDGHTVIAEHPVDSDGTFRTGDEARTVVQIEQPYRNHNGGDLAFGPDGYLYIAMGDGGSGGDPERRATDLSSLLGKILRIEPAIGDGQPYTVPADNPLVGEPDQAPEIWAFGLRNPWRFSFDRQTGDLWIADVGQNEFEEINVAPATDGRDAGRGLFFGWSAFEAETPFNRDVPGDGHTPPVFTYDHGEGCSVSGGVRARGGPTPALEGRYVFADYCSGTVWALEVLGDGASLSAGRRDTLATVEGPTAVVDGPDGAVYVLSGAGPVLRLDPA